MLTMTLMLAAPFAALAGQGQISLEDGQSKDGISGVSLHMDGDEAGVLKRFKSALDPASHRVYVVLRASDGTVVYDGRKNRGSDISPASATTTGPLPADDSDHAFFVPYHRMTLPQGDHVVDAQLMLDLNADPGPVLVAKERVNIAVPKTRWVFTSLEQPPRKEAPLRWRARLGQDVVAERRATPAVVVVAGSDKVHLDLWDPKHKQWVAMDARALRAAERRERLPTKSLRALRVPKPPPGISGGVVELTPANTPTDGWTADLRWQLDGRSVDALLPIEAMAHITDPNDNRWAIPTRPVVQGPDRARHQVPLWGMPLWVAAREDVRLGWRVVARAGSGSPLTRDLELGRADGMVKLAGVPERGVLNATVVGTKVVKGDGLHAEVQIYWHIPAAMASRAEATLRASWGNDPASAYGPWTPCAEEGAPNTCAEAWGISPLSVRHGLSVVRLPLAWLADVSAPSVNVEVGLDGYRPLSATLPVEVAAVEPVKIILQPKKAKLDCTEGTASRLVWSKEGRTLGQTPLAPCAKTTKWPKRSQVEIAGFIGDELDLSLMRGDTVLRRATVSIQRGASLPNLVEPTAGVTALKARLTIVDDAN